MMRRDHAIWKRFFESKLFFIAGIGMLMLLSINLTRAQLKNLAIRREIASLQKEADTLVQERTSLETLIALLQTPEFMEKETRRLLGYTRPGEEVVVIEEKNAECRMQNAECPQESNEKEMSNPKKWWVYFFGS